MKPKETSAENLHAATTVVPVVAHCSDLAQPAAAVPAFDEIYSTYATLLRKIAVVKFSMTVDDAADLVHDVFVSYLSNPGRIENLRSYLIGAVCNASRSHARKGAVQRANCVSIDGCDVANDEQLIDMVTRNLLVGRILGRLGRSCRGALYSFYVRGETMAMIAERRHTSAGYIGRLLHFCRRRARDAYQEVERGKP